MNYVEHHFGDYARDTGHLSLLEHGVYRQLLDLYYVREAALPTDKRVLCRLIRAGSSAEKKALDSVLADFFSLGDDGYRHKRCDAEIVRFRDKQEKAKRSARARWNGSGSHTDGNASAYANASPDGIRTHCEGNAHQTPSTKHQAKAKTKTAEPAARPDVVTEKPVADEPPPDPDRERWRNEVGMLVGQGVSESSARAFVGLQVGDYGSDAVAEAFAASAGKVDVRAYVVGFLRKRQKLAKPAAGVLYRHGQATIGGFVA